MSATDNWCTPAWLTQRMPQADLDPCSNKASTVKAGDAWEHGALDRSWGRGAVYVNPPYSNPLPWCLKAIEHAHDGGEVLMLLKLDPTTRWWGALKTFGVQVYPFRRRLTFDAGPGLAKGCTANFPSVHLWLWRDHRVKEEQRRFHDYLKALVSDGHAWGSL